MQGIAGTRTIFNFCFNFAHLLTLPQIFASSLHYWVLITASSPPLPKPIKRAVLEIITNVKELLNCHLSKKTYNRFSFVIHAIRTKRVLEPSRLRD